MDFLLYNIFMEKFSKEEIGLLVFHEIIKPLNPDVTLVRCWKFPEYSKTEIKALKKALKAIYNLILANTIESEWSPVLTRKLSTRETDFSSDSLGIMEKAKKVS